MAGECLHGFRREPRFDPTRHGKVPKRMPIKAARRWREIRWIILVGGFEFVKEREESHTLRAFHEGVYS